MRVIDLSDLPLDGLTRELQRTDHGDLPAGVPHPGHRVAAGPAGLRTARSSAATAPGSRVTRFQM